MRRIALVKTILILSPHLDDAVLSCGGFMAASAQEDRQVIVFNLFCKPYHGRLLSSAAQELHASWENPVDVCELRLREDRQAISLLEVERVIGDIYDAIYRQDEHGEWLYTSMNEILGERNPADENLVGHYVEKISRDISTEETKILAPLGIGGHVDHLLGYDIGAALYGLGYDVVFYEEIPYALREDWRQARLAALTGLETFVELFSLENLERKITAVRAYASQVPSLFKSEVNVREWLTKSALQVSRREALGGERYWKHG